MNSIPGRTPINSKDKFANRDWSEAIKRENDVRKIEELNTK
jgi:hypothetical protein